MEWIAITDKLPHEKWIEEYPQFAEEQEHHNVLFNCLVSFADVNFGKVHDTEIVPLLYSKRDGWTRFNYDPITKDDLDHITHWMEYPDQVPDKEAQAVYNKKHGVN